jgi:predicted flap endonuclease-1-like 5' DNA nuclease
MDRNYFKELKSWLFNKSVYKKRIAVLESERHEFNNRIINLNADRSNLNKSLIDKDMEIEHLKMKVNAVRALHKEAVHKTDDMKLQKYKTEQLLFKKEEAIIQLLKGRELLNYNSFGTASEAEKDDLKMISDIGPLIEEMLNALEIYTFKQISNLTEDDVQTVTEAIEFFPGRIERDEWILQARELVIKKADIFKIEEGIKGKINFDKVGVAFPHEANNLTLINGIGIWSEERLHVLGIYTFEQKSRLNRPDVEIVAEALNISPDRISQHKWISQAVSLANRNNVTTLIAKN